MKVEDEFWEIIDDALAENQKYIESVPWPLPPAMDPFNITSSRSPAPYNFHSADGQWDMLKELGRRQEVQDSLRRLEQSAPGPSYSAVVRGCTSFSVEPNHSARQSSAMTGPLRHGIDYLQDLFQSPLGEMGRKVLLMEDDSPGDLLNIGDWNDIEVEMVLDSGCCAHIMDAAHDAPDTLCGSPRAAEVAKDTLSATASASPTKAKFT